MSELSALGSKPATLLHHPLTAPQHINVNYLTPVLLTSLVYILNFSADSCLSFQHLRDENQTYAVLTFLLMYAPIIGSMLFSLGNVEVWPEPEGFGKENFKWLVVKIVQHAGFPVWAMYRFAEQLFWSIEAFRSTDKKEIEECLTRAERKSVFELYHFLQAYLQAAPQILLQLHFIFRQSSNFNKATVDMQVFSITISLIKMAMTTVSYQRFKSQKSAGRQCPWRKQPKSQPLITIQDIYRPINATAIPETIQEEEEEEEIIEENELPEEKNAENSDTEADQEINAITVLSRKSSGLSMTSSQFDTKIEKLKQDEPDLILPIKVIFYRGLPQDDAAGKLVSFFWWFCFILPRMLALSAFAYFYTTEIWWLCISHYIICLGFLMYDAHTADIPYYRAVFIIFTAFVYMFCLIEFKIKFKKVRFIYNGYFALVYLENFVMTSIWYHGQEFIFSDWWYRYIYYLIIGSSLISATSMFFYIFILKPRKVTINQGFRNSKVL